jgi:hypothetical protein
VSNLYADVYDYVVFWGIDTPLSGLDNSGALGNAFLTDTLQDFIAMGVPLGAPIRNLTQGTQGQVLSLTGASRLNTGTLLWDTGDLYAVVNADRAQQATIAVPLDMAAGDVAMALAAVDALNCTKSVQGANFLRQLTCTIAAVLYNAPCGSAHFSDAMRRTMIEWVEKRLDGLRDGSIEVCQGFTGADWPAFGAAQQGLTDRSAAQLIYDRYRRGS